MKRASRLTARPNSALSIVQLPDTRLHVERRHQRLLLVAPYLPPAAAFNAVSLALGLDMIRIKLFLPIIFRSG